MAVFEILMLYISLVGTKLCKSEIFGQSMFGTPEMHYDLYKKLYSGCTEIDGPLELSNLILTKRTNLEFLFNITKIRDYLLLFKIKGQTFSLPNLRLIQGIRLYASKSIYVSTTSLAQFKLPRLVEISAGDICIPQLESSPKILFSDIFKSSDQKVEFEKESAPQVECSSTCPLVDNERYCWGPEEEDCQKLSKQICHRNCQNRCFGPDSLECCHDQCIAGCLSQGNSQCTICRNYNLNGVCVENCPKVQIQDIDGEFIYNKNGYYGIGSNCVKECPSPYFHDVRSSLCLTDCGEGYKGVVDKCQPCETPYCEMKCNLETIEGTVIIDKDIMKNIINCTVIRGNLLIDHIFFDQIDSGLITKAQMAEFRKIRTVTGYLLVFLNTNMTSLEFLPPNLTVRGDNIIPTIQEITAIIVGNDYFIGNINLNVYKGEVRIMSRNDSFCYYNHKYYDKWVHPPYVVVTDYNQTWCERHGKVCDPECIGCTGPGNMRCISCKNFIFRKKESILCLKSCDGDFFAVGKNCYRCSEMCQNGCIGPRADQCEECKIALFDGFCVKECPSTHFMAQKKCTLCNPLCTPSNKKTCWGPLSSKGPNGCEDCFYKEIDDGKSSTCLDINATVPENYYSVVINDKRIYKPCHEECLTCEGPKNTDCIQCREFEFISQEINSGKLCLKECPPNYVPDYKTRHCRYYDKVSLIVKIISAISCLLIIVLFVMSLITVKLAKRVNNEENISLLHETGIPPNMSVVKTFDEKTLKLETKIGQGSFGTVYKAILFVENINKIKHVAVKELNSRMEEMADFEREIKVMASCDYKHCVKLFGICMTENIKLIMELCPRGSLIKILTERRQLLSPNKMLKWSCQIADGMNYLEHLGVVHCDLAARNILLDDKYDAKIADFGLSNMIDNKYFYRQGPKFSIRWVAPECLDMSLHSHKSDVWSFGVTLWEILTYGQIPYDHLKNCEIQDFLIRGRRLPQPTAASIDIFLLLHKCWQLHTNQRPTFEELYKSLMVMHSDSKRYIKPGEGDPIVGEGFTWTTGGSACLEKPNHCRYVIDL